MTLPPMPVRVGLNPLSSDEVNVNIGTLLRQFMELKQRVAHDRDWLSGVNLQDPPYSMTADAEATMKTAVNGLDDSFDAIDLTFINRLVGIW